jgi:PleD family two-component response regulator
MSQSSPGPGGSMYAPILSYHPLLVSVDPDPGKLELVKAIATQAGYYYKGFQKAQELIEFLKGDEKVSLIISEIKVPDIDGINLAYQLRKSIKTRFTPIILLTQLEPDRQTILTGFQAGASEVFFKSRDMDFLGAKLQAYLPLLYRIDFHRAAKNAGMDPAKETAEGKPLLSQNFPPVNVSAQAPATQNSSNEEEEYGSMEFNPISGNTPVANPVLQTNPPEQAPPVVMPVANNLPPTQFQQEQTQVYKAPTTATFVETQNSEKAHTGEIITLMDMYTKMGLLLKQAKQYQGCFGLVLIRFKLINEQTNLQAVRSMRNTLSQPLCKPLQTGDLVSLMEADGFMLILPNQNEQAAAFTINAIVNQVEERIKRVTNSINAAKISVGYTVARGTMPVEQGINTLIAHVEKALGMALWQEKNSIFFISPSRQNVQRVRVSK